MAYSVPVKASTWAETAVANLTAKYPRGWRMLERIYAIPVAYLHRIIKIDQKRWYNCRKLIKFCDALYMRSSTFCTYRTGRVKQTLIYKAAIERFRERGYPPQLARQIAALSDADHEHFLQQFGPIDEHTWTTTQMLGIDRVLPI